MSTIHFNETTALTPEQLVAGLTDFGAGRSKIVSKSVLGKAFDHSIKAIEAKDGMVSP
jgi:hypothetical protein